MHRYPEESLELYVVKCSQKQKRTTYFTDPNGNEQV